MSIYFTSDLHFGHPTIFEKGGSSMKYLNYMFANSICVRVEVKSVAEIEEAAKRRIEKYAKYFGKM